jgi:hypothetical protein
MQDLIRCGLVVNAKTDRTDGATAVVHQFEKRRTEFSPQCGSELFIFFQSGKKTQSLWAEVDDIEVWTEHEHGHFRQREQGLDNVFLSQVKI